MSIIVENLTYKYMPDSPFESTALHDVSFTIEDGEFVGIIGHTGSGKSTLIQHFNGLLKPTSGKIIVNGVDLSDKSVKLKKIRQEVGLVFQYPEYQLFEETIYKDIAFGPKNMGLSEETIQSLVKQSMEMVGLNYEALKDRSPFALSGGQKRRVAMAGILAMNPKILVLDEPTASLDPAGRDEILDKVIAFHKKYHMTTVIVSHDMESIARMVDKVIVMDKGTISMIGTPKEVFQKGEELKKIGLGVPQITELMQALKAAGFDVRTDIINTEEAYPILKSLLEKSAHD